MFRIQKICATPFLLRGRHQESLKELDISLCTSFPQAACEKCVSCSTPGVVGNILACYTLVGTPPLVWVTAGILWVWKSNGHSFCILTSPLSLWDSLFQAFKSAELFHTLQPPGSLFSCSCSTWSAGKRKKKKRKRSSYQGTKVCLRFVLLLSF